ncbi:hypothetical protein D3C85_1195400 [compost metagenome]
MVATIQSLYYVILFLTTQDGCYSALLRVMWAKLTVVISRSNVSNVSNKHSKMRLLYGCPYQRCSEARRRVHGNRFSCH